MVCLSLAVYFIFLAAGCSFPVSANSSPKGKVLIIGGMETPRTFEVWSPDFNTKSLVGTLAQPRFAHSAARLPNGRVLVCGGLDDEVNRLSSCEALDPDSLSSSHAAPLPESRVGHAAAPLGDAVFLCGGHKSGVGILSSCIRYRDGAWTSVASMRKSREHFPLASNGRFLFACGGWNGTHNQASCERYDAAADHWTLLPSMLPGGGRDNLGSVFGDDGRLYVIGGLHGPTATATGLNNVDIFDPASGTWTQGPRLTTPRHGHSVVNLNGAIWALGGWETERSAEVLEPGVVIFLANQLVGGFSPLVGQKPTSGSNSPLAESFSRKIYPLVGKSTH